MITDVPQNSGNNSQDAKQNRARYSRKMYPSEFHIDRWLSRSESRKFFTLVFCR